MLVGTCQACGAPANLRCTICARTFCQGCLDADERLCPDCIAYQRKNRGLPMPGHPPSRRIARRV